VSFAFAAAVFGVRIHGSPLGFALVLAMTAMMCAAFGLMIAGVGRTPAGARGISIAAVLVLVMIGGAWAPTFIFPEWLQLAAKVSPVFWAVDGFDAMTWRGLGLGRGLQVAGVLGAYAAVFAAIGFRKFNWDN
jgi:ABC-2 type transport system permease protein